MNSSGIMRWFIWLSQLFYLLLLFYSQLTSSSSSFNSSSPLLCSQDQSSALLQFKQLFSLWEYASLDCDISYPKIESWKEGTDCCSWDGVTCDSVRGDVIGLDLSCSRLYGTIPSNASLFLLPHLQRLNLAFNYFNYSQISSGFGRFAKLRYLNLSWSFLEGQVPLELSHLSQLSSLDLSGNFRVSFETSIVKRLVQNMTKLRELHLDWANMSSVSLISFMNFSSLVSLTLEYCEMCGSLPDDIYGLSNLRKLNLADNYLNGTIPSSLSNLKELSYLDLQWNYLSGPIPASLGNLTKVTQIFLDSNYFTGHIPSSLSHLKDLNRIDLSFNKFQGSIPMFLGKLTKVTEIMLQNNNFTGHIPSSLSNLKDLTFINFSHNNFGGFGGKIPFLTNLTKLIAVDLSYNQLTSQMCEFQPNNSLQTLRLENNRLYGSIPNSISNLENLRELYLSSNNLSGIVEFDESTNFKELDTLHLSNNSLFLGIKSNSNHTFPLLRNLSMSSCNIIEFPKFLKSSKYLEHLDLSNNRIPNQIPEWIFEVVENLQFLDLNANLLQGNLPVPPSTMITFFMSNNRLTGEIPSMICNASNLENLDISNNRLSGEIPSSICNVTSIEIFDISYNSLSGTIPSCLGNFSNSLVVMDLRRNNFYGTMPETFAEGNMLRTLVFNGNQLEGLLPKSLVNCKYLEVLDIGNNKINDSFPYWLEDLPVLQVLILRSNKFNGQLDNFKTKSSFSLLRIIDLSHNEFSGSLPTNFFKGLKAIKTTKESEGEVKYMEQGYYQDSVIVAMKGQIVLERILTIFTTIDLSSNKFHGKIPEVIGMLNFLRGLNLSHNRLIGHIPSSLGLLSVLESLDLSSNRLNGEIPMQLTSLTFLAVLNLSQNQLMGPIPQGKQFGTFQNNSYGGNLGLCGFPLSKNCGIDERPPPPIFQEDNDPMFMSGFGWEAVLLGYGCGLVFGIAMGYFMFKIGKPQCLLGLIEENRPRKLKMPSNQRSRGSRNYSI